MKATGIVRRFDDLGRIVIPKEIRRMLHLHDGDAMEIFIDGASLVLTKYNPGDPILNMAIALREEVMDADWLSEQNSLLKTIDETIRLLKEND